ncbi:methyl-accepting chemotaxis protein [Massilia antarctica]|uniref:methyl-accepting chemotaxis protein n=1 Tax=Massilia antarctica TaxID=2765360 RepID=UPI00351CF159
MSKVEYILRASETIVSKTDLQGNITYVNLDFIRISGFSEAELIGSPQNLVRHPDMPAEAFADFWRTIQSGKAWTGLVKNRCKNGDFYWVEATAAPMIEQGRIVGFTSIRVKPSRAQVSAAEQAYRAIKDGRGGLEVRAGAVLRHSALRRLNLSSRLSLGARIVASTLLVALLFGVSLGAHGGAARLTAALGLCVSLLSGWLLYRAVVPPLLRARSEIERMSEGDLTGRIDAGGNDELSRVLGASGYCRPMSGCWSARSRK